MSPSLGVCICFTIIFYPVPPGSTVMPHVFVCVFTVVDIETIKTFHTLYTFETSSEKGIESKTIMVDTGCISTNHPFFAFYNHKNWVQVVVI